LNGSQIGTFVVHSTNGASTVMPKLELDAYKENIQAIRDHAEFYSDRAKAATFPRGRSAF
jgi:hypothetical protein